MIEIKGHRVTLRTMTREEFHQARRAYVPDPVMDPDPYTYDPEEVDARYDALCARESWYPTVGIFTRGGRIIGELSFKRVDREKGRCELGIALSNDGVKGRGYGSEAFALAVSYAFDALGLAALYADTMGSNRRMQRLLHSLGFCLYARHEACYDMRGRPEDRLDYVLWKEEIRQAERGDLPAVRALVAEGFRKFVAPMDDAFFDRVFAGEMRTWCLYRKGRLAGVLSMRDVSHIKLLFVREDFHRQGVARALLQAALDELAPLSPPEITVNASPYALPAYRRLGFVETGPQQAKDGLRFTPMRLLLKEDARP